MTPFDTNSANLEHGRLISLINSMADGVIAVDEKYIVVLYNAAALNILDINTSIAEQALKDVVVLFSKDNKMVDIETLIKNTKIPLASREYMLHYSDGSMANLYLNIAPVHLGYGVQGDRGFVMVMRDITKEKSLEEERDEFISVVSHELRTPIAIAEGNISNAQFIANKSADITAIKHAIKEAHGQILFLSDIVNDLATLSRAERGRLTVQVEAINIYDLIHKLSADYQEEASKKGLKIRVEISPELEILNSSKLYIHEILQNFITNALKYTQQGSITIAAKPKEDGIEFQVTDTGIGISKPDQEKIFTKFFRGEDYRTKETKGTGLGLYITKKLANLLHAKIKVDSELNKGSTFTILIPQITQNA